MKKHITIEKRSEIVLCHTLRRHFKRVDDNDIGDEDFLRLVKLTQQREATRSRSRVAERSHIYKEERGEIYSHYMTSSLWNISSSARKWLYKYGSEYRGIKHSIRVIQRVSIPTVLIIIKRNDFILCGYRSGSTWPRITAVWNKSFMLVR